MMNETSKGNRLITAFFDSREDANEAIERLKSSGVPSSAIRLTEGSGSTGSSAGSLGSSAGNTGGMSGNVTGMGGTSAGSHSRPREEQGFWASLADLFLPEEDTDTYAEGLRRGGYLVSARVSDAQYERALDILDDEGTINLDERASSWRSEGWTPGQSGYGSAASTGAMGGGYGASAESSRAAGVPGRAASATTGTKGRQGEEVIPVTQEQLRVGKREVEHGRVRVRSYTIERPVQEQVNLREEHVSVERRPVDRATTGTEDAFRERTIEAEEKREVPVVSKEARVTEEVVVKKGVEQRNETVSDTVRSTQVEVEDDREDRRGTGTTGSGRTDRR